VPRQRNDVENGAKCSSPNINVRTLLPFSAAPILQNPIAGTTIDTYPDTSVWRPPLFGDLPESSLVASLRVEDARPRVSGYVSMVVPAIGFCRMGAAEKGKSVLT